MGDRFSAQMEHAQLSWEDQRIEVGCEIDLADDGEVRISVNAIPVHANNAWILELENANQHQVQVLTIVGIDSEGRLLRSDNAYIVSSTSRSDHQGSRWDLQLRTMELTVTPSQSEVAIGGLNRCQVEYYTIGQEGFHEIEREVELGTIAILGEHSPDNFDHLTGAIIISGESRANELSEWYCDAERLAARLLGGLSIAQGRRIHWSVRRRCVGEHLDCLTLAGPSPTSSPREPLFSPLNQEPIVAAILENYTETLRESTGIDVALDWYLAHPRFLEAEFLTLMTALEHLVNRFMESEATRLLARCDFKKLRSELKAVIYSEVERMTSEMIQLPMPADELIQTLNDGLGNLNRHPLRRNILSMLNHYSVPIGDLEEQVPEIVRIRNDLVHQGVTERATISSHLVSLRELMKRVFLTLFGYRGEYRTCLGGWRLRSL